MHCERKRLTYTKAVDLAIGFEGPLIMIGYIGYSPSSDMLDNMC
jgi:hypothetical protein